MAWIRTIPEDQATGALAQIYAEIRKGFPIVPNVMKAFSSRPARGPGSGAPVWKPHRSWVVPLRETRVARSNRVWAVQVLRGGPVSAPFSEET